MVSEAVRTFSQNTKRDIAELLHTRFVQHFTQVTDMMIANSACLVVTIRPFNQRHNVRRRGATPPPDDEPPDPVLPVPRDVDDDEVCEHLPSHLTANHVTTGSKALPCVPIADRGDWVILA